MRFSQSQYLLGRGSASDRRRLEQRGDQGVRKVIILSTHLLWNVVCRGLCFNLICTPRFLPSRFPHFFPFRRFSRLSHTGCLLITTIVLCTIEAGAATDLPDPNVFRSRVTAFLSSSASITSLVLLVPSNMSSRAVVLCTTHTS